MGKGRQKPIPRLIIIKNKYTTKRVFFMLREILIFAGE